MSYSQKDDQPLNWSYVSNSAPNSLVDEVQEMPSLRNHFESEMVVLFSKLKEDVWLSANRSFAKSLQDYQPSCLQCEEVIAVSIKLQMELNEIKRELLRLLGSIEQNKESCYNVRSERSKPKCLNDSTVQCSQSTQTEDRENFYISNLNQPRSIKIHDCPEIRVPQHVKITNVVTTTIHSLKLNQPSLDDIWSNLTLTNMDEKTSEQWIKDTHWGLNSEDNEDYKQEATVKTILETMVNFPTNARIREIALTMMQRTDLVESFCFCICKSPDILQRLMEEYGAIYLKWILVHLVESDNDSRILLQPVYLTIFLKDMSDAVFTDQAFHAMLVLARLLDCTTEEFPTDVPKDIVEKYTRARLQNMRLKSQFEWFKRDDYSWFLDRIITGSKAQIHFCTLIICWGIISRKYRNGDAPYESVLQVIEKVSSNPSTDNSVLEVVKPAIAKIRKKLAANS